MNKNIELSKELANLTGPRIKMCYKNSFNALFVASLLDDGLDEVFYIEGWMHILDGALLIEHGWLEIGGEIVDVSDFDTAAESYCPVLRFTKNELTARLHKEHALPLFFNNKEEMRDMIAAMQKLYRKEWGDGQATSDAGDGW